CFIQAEDGIRDRNVTRVQTCALPILFIISCVSFRLCVTKISSLDKTVSVSSQEGIFFSGKSIASEDSNVARNILCAYTIASSKELEANLLAPCKPVEEHSPQAYRFLILLDPFSSTKIPPQE